MIEWSTTAIRVCPLHVDSSRRRRANSGHCRTARRTDHNPDRSLAVGVKRTPYSRTASTSISTRKSGDGKLDTTTVVRAGSFPSEKDSA